QAVLHRLEFIAPALSQLLGENIDHIIETRGPIGTIALLGLIWSASTIFYTFTDTMNEIWGMRHHRPVWRKRGLAILFVLIFAGPMLFIASIAGSFLAYLRTFVPGPVIEMEWVISWLMATLLNIALFMMLYMMLPHAGAT